MEDNATTIENKPEPRRKGRLRSMLTPRRVIVSLFLFWLFFFAPLFGEIGQSLVRGVVQRIYTPPTLTEERVSVYAEFIRLVQNRPDHDVVSLDRWGRLFLTYHVDFQKEPVGEWCDLGMSGGEPSPRMKTMFSPMELAALKDLSAKMAKVHCVFAVMVNRAGKYSFFTFEPHLGAGYPVAVYVMAPRDPNDIDDTRQWTGLGTLEHIKGRWYASRQLRTSARAPWYGPTVPKSWFDCSLKVPSNLDAESATLSSK